MREGQKQADREEKSERLIDLSTATQKPLRMALRGSCERFMSYHRCQYIPDMYISVPAVIVALPSRYNLPLS